MFDLSSPSSKASADAGYTFEPLLPDGEPVGWTITIRGAESAKVRAVFRKQVAESEAREAQAKRTGKKIELSADEVDAANAELAAAHIMGWTAPLDGKPAPQTEEAFREAMLSHSWLRSQVIVEGQVLGNFVKRASKPSLITPAPAGVLT